MNYSTVILIMIVVVGVVNRFLDMHMYITSALQKTDMKAVGLQLALELLHEKVCTIFLIFIIRLLRNKS